METIKESNNVKIKRISFGKHSNQPTAQVVVITEDRKGKKRSETFHLHYQNGTWLYVEKVIGKDGKLVEQGYEFVADCLPKSERGIALALARVA